MVNGLGSLTILNLGKKRKRKPLDIVDCQVDIEAPKSPQEIKTIVIDLCWS